MHRRSQERATHCNSATTFRFGVGVGLKHEHIMRDNGAAAPRAARRAAVERELTGGVIASFYGQREPGSRAVPPSQVEAVPASPTCCERRRRHVGFRLGLQCAAQRGRSAARMYAVRCARDTTLAS